MTANVLIVGAGPTGLTLALALQRYGIEARIIDQRADRLENASKALSLNPNSLRVLDHLGVMEPFLKAGQKTRAFQVSFRDQRLARIRFDRLATPYPYFLMLPQPQTEQFLEDALCAQGATVGWGQCLERVVQTADGVTAEIRHRDGRLERASFAYVLAADGGRSRTRQQLGISFTGHDYSNMYFVLADAVIEWDGDRSIAHYFCYDQGFMVLAPLDSQHHRLVIKVPGTFQPGQTIPWEEFQQHARRFGPPGLRLKNPIWQSSAPFYNRLCATNDAGRVFLVGDAAHLFSPIGGHGMNTGIGDAFNLAWKLAYVLKGWAHESLLRSYHRERHEIAAQLVQQTDLSTSMIARLDHHTAADEERLLPRMSNRSWIRTVAPAMASGLGQRYPAREGGAAGGLIPYVLLRSGPVGLATQALVRPGRYLLLVQDPEATRWERWKGLAQRFAHCLDIINLGPHPRAPGGILTLCEGTESLGSQLGWNGEGMVLIRPDHYISSCRPYADPEELEDRLHTENHLQLPTEMECPA